MLTFLKKHYEKIILTAFLIIFMLSLIWQIHIIMNAVINYKELVFETRDPDHKKIILADYDTIDRLADPLRWTRSQARNPEDRDFTDLLVPIIAARCPHCTHIIPQNNFLIDKKCSWCGEELTPPQRDTTSDPKIDHDSDGDGIPDKYEMEHGLNPQDPSDAYGDLDEDGFPNLYEYKISKTKPNDPKSRPSLANWVVVTKVLRVQIPIRITSVKTNSSEDKTKWLIQAEDLRRRRTLFLSLNDEIAFGKDKYKITDVEYREREVFNPTVKAMTNVDASVVTLEKADKKDTDISEAIKAEVRKPVYEPQIYVELRNIITNEAYDRLPVTGIFQVGNNSTGIERFIIVKIDEEKQSLDVRELDDQGRMKGAPQTIGAKSVIEDFIKDKREAAPASVPGEDPFAFQ